MPQAVDNSSTSELAQIAARLHDLEGRVAALEGHLETSMPGASHQVESVSAQSQSPTPLPDGRRFPTIEMPTGAMPVLGKSVLGIAGAYLLRALAEAGPIPKLLVLIVAIIYAGLWMIWAVRTHPTHRFASTTYGVTSVLILSALLWESTERFQVIPPIFTAVVLVGFSVFVLALSRRAELQVIPWVAMLAVVITDLGLIATTHDVVPLTTALLAVAIITEIAACVGYPLTWRAVPALAADFGIWLLVDVMTSPGGPPEGYHPASSLTLTVLCFVLIATYSSSIVVRGFAQRQKFTVFEIIQSVLAFGLVTFGILRAAPSSEAWLLGPLCLLLAAIFYWGALSRFGDEANSRNRRISATWAGTLLIAGIFLAFGADLGLTFFCFAALAVAFLYSRTRKFSLGVHTSLYLAAATALSPLPTYVASALAGQVPSTTRWSIWIIGATAMFCYLLGARVPEDRNQRRLLWVVPVALVGLTSTAILVVGISGISMGRMEMTPSRLSVVRTIMNCVLALVLGLTGSRSKHIELGWVAYAAIAFGTIKLLLDDLRFGNAFSLVASLLCYGSILILLPRLTRRATS